MADARFDPIFPGMDPFIEGQAWPDLHTLMIAACRLSLSTVLIPQYAVLTETYVGIRTRPDVAILRGKRGTEPLAVGTAVADEATRVITPTIYEPQGQRRIEIYDENGDLVTVIEMLSPANKRGVGRGRYLSNRDALMETSVNLIEIDLLRGGQRMEATMPTAGYTVTVWRVQPSNAHRGELYEIGLRDPLPVIPVPLAVNDHDVTLNLQAIFSGVYQQAGYRLQLDYTQSPAVPFAPDDADWVRGRLEAAGL